MERFVEEVEAGDVLCYGDDVLSVCGTCLLAVAAGDGQHTEVAELTLHKFSCTHSHQRRAAAILERSVGRPCAAVVVPGSSASRHPTSF